MDDLIKLIFASSFFILFYSMVGKYVRNTLNLTDPMITIAYGMVIGHHGLSILNTHYVYSKLIVLNFSKLVLCLQTMSIALSIPKKYLKIDFLKSNLKPLSNLIFTIGFLKCSCTFLLLKLTTHFNASTAWALSAALTPTDPILSSSIIRGEFSRKNVPEKLKHLLNAESGINDGIGIILLYISLDIMRHLTEEDKAISKGGYLFSSGYKLAILLENYLFHTIFVKLLISAAIGCILGSITRIIAKLSYKRQLINSDILLIHTFSLTALSLSIMTFINGSELICIFFCGIYLNLDEWYTTTKISDVIENAFTNSLFVFLGSRVDFYRFSPRMFLVCFIILFIRPVLVYLCRNIIRINIHAGTNYLAGRNSIVSTVYNGHSTDEMNSYQVHSDTENISSHTLTDVQSTKTREPLFIGWFGPIGVGAIYYSLLYDCKVEALTVDYAMCAVLLSILLHGLSVPTYILFKKLDEGQFAHR